jgi:hypothetical protein
MPQPTDELHALADRLAAAVKAFAGQPDKVSVQVLRGDCIVLLVLRCAADDLDPIGGERGARLAAFREQVGTKAQWLGFRAYLNVYRLPLRRIRLGAPA